MDLKSTGLQSSKFRFCSNIKVSDTGFITGPHQPAALDVDSAYKIQENGVIVTSSDSRDSKIQLMYDTFIQKREGVDYQCRFAHRHAPTQAIVKKRFWRDKHRFL